MKNCPHVVAKWSISVFCSKNIKWKSAIGQKKLYLPCIHLNTINQNWLENQQNIGLKEIVSFLMDLHSDLSTITIKHNKYHALKVKLE